MNRRALLRACGVALGSGALAGCSTLLGGEESTTATGGPPSDRESVTPSPTPTRERSAGHTRTATTSARETGTGDGTAGTDGPDDGRGDDATGDRFQWAPAGEEVLRTSVGDPGNVVFPENTEPVTVRIWNESLSRRTFRLALVDPSNGGTHWERSVTFGPEDYAVVDVVEPGYYDLVLYRIGEALGVVELRRDAFDCNTVRFSARIRSDGSFQVFGSSTRKGCPDPDIVGTEFTHDPAECVTATGDSLDPEGASVRGEDGSVHVSGWVAVPSTCYTLSDLVAVHDGRRDRLDLTVTVEETGGDCRECKAVVPYDAVVGFDHAYPTSVVVSHGTDGRMSEVVSVERYLAD